MEVFKKLLVVSMLVMAVAFAANTASANNPMEKLGRGLAQVVLCPFEIPIQISDVAEEQGNVAALSYGLVRGLAYMVARFVAGAIDVVTFFIPLPGCNESPYERGWGYGPLLFQDRPWVFDVEHNWFGFFYNDDSLVGAQY